MEDIKLKPNKEDRVQVMPIGDIHYGAPTCDEELLKEKIQQCLQKKIYVIGMGDMLESGLRDSVGDSVYSQVSNPQVQHDKIYTLFEPLADAGLLIGFLLGNHEERIIKATSFDPIKSLSKLLNVPYLGYGCFLRFLVDTQKYTVYATHGSISAATPYGKIQGAAKIANFINADLILYAHTHGLEHTITLKLGLQGNKEVETKTHTVLTGSFLKYQGSYAEHKNLMPGRIGTPLISFYGNKHEIFVSL